MTLACSSRRNAAGIVKSVQANRIVVAHGRRQGKMSINSSNIRVPTTGTCINQLPLVFKGDRVEKGEVLADGPSTDKGEIALGKNILMGFMTWEGYNYEDAVLHLRTAGAGRCVHLDPYRGI